MNDTATQEGRVALGYGGFWRRFAALIIDGAVLMIIADIPVLLGIQSLGVLLLTYVLMLAYYVVGHASPYQATVGKYLAGVKVVMTDGRRISYLRSLGRSCATLLSSITLNIGYLIAAFTERKQALHDFVAGTCVIRVGKSHLLWALPLAIIAMIGYQSVMIGKRTEAMMLMMGQDPMMGLDYYNSGEGDSVEEQMQQLEQQ